MNPAICCSGSLRQQQMPLISVTPGKPNSSGILNRHHISRLAFLRGDRWRLLVSADASPESSATTWFCCTCGTAEQQQSVRGCLIDLGFICDLTRCCSGHKSAPLLLLSFAGHVGPLDSLPIHGKHDRFRPLSRQDQHHQRARARRLGTQPGHHRGVAGTTFTGAAAERCAKLCPG